MRMLLLNKIIILLLRLILLHVKSSIGIFTYAANIKANIKMELCKVKKRCTKLIIVYSLAPLFEFALQLFQHVLFSDGLVKMPVTLFNLELNC